MESNPAVVVKPASEGRATEETTIDTYWIIGPAILLAMILAWVVYEVVAEEPHPPDCRCVDCLIGRGDI